MINIGDKVLYEDYKIKEKFSVDRVKKILTGEILGY
jgi:hypothetical protein